MTPTLAVPHDWFRHIKIVSCSEPEPERQKQGGSGSEKRQRNPEEFVTSPVSSVSH